MRVRMRSREVEGWVRAAVALRTVARLRCMAECGLGYGYGAWQVRPRAGWQVRGCSMRGWQVSGRWARASSWMSSHTARLALRPSAPSQCIACASLDLQKSFHSCASLCLYSWWCGKPSAPSTCSASAVSCSRGSRQVSKHVDKAITPCAASPPHYLRTTCERLTSYWLGWRAFCILYSTSSPGMKPLVFISTRKARPLWSMMKSAQG